MRGGGSRRRPDELTQGESSESNIGDPRVLALRSGKKIPMPRRRTEDTEVPKPQLSLASPLPHRRPSLPFSYSGALSSPPPPQPSGGEMDKVVCETCGSDSAPPLIAKCVQCSSYEHRYRYCMKEVAFSIPPEWVCYDCRKKNNGDSRPDQGGQNELQRSFLDFGQIKERENQRLDLGHSNAVPQITPYTRKRSKGPKVKFISSEEVALLNRERRPYGRSNSAMRQGQVLSTSPPNLKEQSKMKCTSPTRRDTQVLALNRCITASRDQEKIENRSYADTWQNQVRPACPPNFKQSSSMNCMSPSTSGTQMHSPLKQSVAASDDQANIEDRSEFATRNSQVPPASPPNVKHLSNTNSTPPSRSGTQVHALKRCVASSNEARNRDLSMNQEPGHGISMPMINICRTDAVIKGKVDSQIDEKTKEKETVSADKGKITSHMQGERREKEALCASDDVTGCESEMKSPNPNTDTILIIKKIEASSRRHSDKKHWTGCILVLDRGTMHNFGEYEAFLPVKVSRKAYDMGDIMPRNLKLEILPRFDDWPKSFETVRPGHEDIGLFFFNKPDRNEKKHPPLFETYCNFVMRAYINDIKLLIYSSEVLPADSEWIDGKRYLWGAFVRPKGKKNHQHLGSTST